MDRLDRITTLFRRRWACPLLAELYRTDGAKFISLVSALDANPGGVRQSLDELIRLEWVRRNPGYGHPLRPEYILTRRGERLAPACASLHSAIRDSGAEDTALRRWSMATLYVIGTGPTRFTQVTRALSTATARAISIALKDLSMADLINRTILDCTPPGTAYGAAPAGERLLPILESL